MHAVRLALLFALTMAPLAAHAGEGPAAQINCTDAVGIPGGTALVEVTLVREDGADVVGTQNDLSYDAARFSIDRGDCFINPEIGPDSPLDKGLQDNVLVDPPRLRGIVVSLNNVAPIPAGLLYSCPFHVAADTPLGTYGIGNGNFVASNADGSRLPVDGSDCQIEVAEPTITPTPTPQCREDEDCPDGQVCVDGECVVATPTATGTAGNPSPTRTATPGCEDNDDCPIGQVCVNNMCVTPTPTPRCRQDMDCPSGQVCVEGECVNATPTASPTVTTRRSSGGGGCSCEIDPGAPTTSMSDVLAVLLPALVLLMRWRTRRSPH